MFNEKQKSDFRKRLSEIPDLGHREDGQGLKLEELLNEICSLADNDDRTKKEKQFQDQLLDLENHVAYLKGRWKI